MEGENKLFKISKVQYDKIIEKCKKNELIIMIDTSSYRQLFCDKTERNGLENIIDVPLSSKSTLIRVIFYALPLFGIAMSIFSILAFKVWATLILPILIIISLVIHSKASVGKQNINGAIIFVIIGIICFFYFSDKGVFFRIVLILFPVQIFLSKFLYYHTSKTVFKLLFANYKFFAIFYGIKYSEQSMSPMIFTNSVEQYNEFLKFKKKYNLDFKHYKELLNIRSSKQAWKQRKENKS